MGRKLIDRAGVEINGIKIISLNSTETNKNTKWNCECHCGNTFVTTYYRLHSNKTKSCGCEKYTSFITDYYTYSSYNSMIQRCTNPYNDSYHKYGGVGVEVCSRWVSKGETGYLNFLEDMGPRPKNTSINRIGSVPMYSKETCEWASASTQSYDQKIRKDNPSGVKGVKYRNDRNKWTSFIYVDKVYIQLYYGDSFSEAVRLRIEAEKKYYG